jgi:hypothetical protein
MVKTAGELEKAVKTRIRAPIFNSLKQHVNRNHGNLWAKKKGIHFVDQQLILALYKYLFNCGYNRLNAETHSWHGMGVKSLQHNNKVIFESLREWAQDQIKQGTSQDWNRAARHLQLTGCVAKANLWQDSTDIATEGRRTIKRSSPDWSFKKNRPARRYMMLSDGLCRVRGMWGGYSPKVYDGTFLELFQDTFKKNFKGGVIVADGHFEKGNKLFKDPKFLTPKRQPAQPRASAKNLQVLTKADQSRNNAIHNARARVESIFGIINKKFECFSVPWRESAEHLDNVVWTAVGIMNREVN